MFINSFSCAIFEKALQSVLQLDPQLTAQLTPLDGKVIAWRYKKTQQYVYFSIKNNHITVTSDSEKQPDVTIATGLVSWIRLLPGKNQFGSSAVTIEGDLAVLQHLQKILVMMELDGEGWLADKIGVVPAHRIFLIVKSVLQGIRELLEGSAKMTGAYLTQEKKMIVGRDEMRIFCDSVIDTRLAVDALEKRIEKLTKE